jgi:hypothetical protein
MSPNSRYLDRVIAVSNTSNGHSGHGNLNLNVSSNALQAKQSLVAIGSNLVEGEFQV